MIMEDISSLGELEEQALLDNNIVARVAQLMTAVIDVMQQGT
jgi:hypothetical protein